MLRYRVAFDPERGHFVLPTLPAMVRFEETFTSRAAAKKIAQGRNAQMGRAFAKKSDQSAQGVCESPAVRRASA